jgi:hypothetical protein
MTSPSMTRSASRVRRAVTVGLGQDHAGQEQQGERRRHRRQLGPPAEHRAEQAEDGQRA